MTFVSATSVAAITTRKAEIAEACVADQYMRFPELVDRYGAAGRAKCVHDVMYHVEHLAGAVRGGDPSLFHDYINWVRMMMESHGVDEADVIESLRSLKKAIRRCVPGQEGSRAVEIITASLRQFESDAVEEVHSSGDAGEHESLARMYTDLLLKGDRTRAAQAIMDAVNSGANVRDLYIHVFQWALRHIGHLWQSNRISVAQEHFFTAATQMIMSQLYPVIFSTPRCGRRIVATCITGDLHEVGVRMVSDFFELAGWDSYYIGANTPQRSIVTAITEHQAHVLAVSVTMTPHIEHAASLIENIRNEDSCRNVRVLVGGRPFNHSGDLWKRIGADGTAPDAAGAVEVAEQLVASGATHA